MTINFPLFLEEFLSPKILSDILYSIISILALWLIRKFTIGLITRHSKDAKTLFQSRKIANYIIGSLSVLILIIIWLGGFKDLATYLGLVSAGLAIALQETITNIVGWLFILFKRPFRIGDRIQIGEFTGDVIDQRIFQFHLIEVGNWVNADQSTGRIIYIPNNLIFKKALANFSSGFEFIWNEIPVLITFESDWQKAKNILVEIANQQQTLLQKSALDEIQQASREFLISYNKLTPIVYTSTRESGILLTIRYICKPRERRITEHAIWELILKQFEPCTHIDFAYPTTRYYDNLNEGKNNPKIHG
ncbi:MAG: mechanosensitive ion channel [Anaerolineaceae bacterium]|nr:mechanosensitive ion channel [Anaerolineaceae bacterium]